MGSSSSIVGDSNKEKSQSYNKSNSIKTNNNNNLKNEKIIDYKYNNIDLDSPTIQPGLLSNDSPSDLSQFSYKTINGNKIKSNKSDTPPIQPVVFPNDSSPFIYVTLNDKNTKSNKSDSTNGLITEQLLYELSKLTDNNTNDHDIKIKSNKIVTDKRAATVEYEYDTTHSKSFQIQPENYDQIFLERRHSSSVTPNNHSSNTLNYTNSTVIHMSRRNSLNVSNKDPNELLYNFNPLDRIDSTIELECPSSIAIHCGLCNVTFDDEEKYYYHLNYSKQHWILLQENINK